MKITVQLINHNRKGFGKEDIDIQSYKESEIILNDALSIVQEEHYNAEGNCINRTINQYNNNNELIVSQLFDEENELVQKTLFQYNTDGKMIARTDYYGEGSGEYTTRYKYENGLLLQQDSFDGEEYSFTEKKLTYQGTFLIQQIDYNDYGEQQYQHDYKYDDDGNLVQYIRNEIIDKDRRTFDYEYEGNKKIKELIYNYNDELIAAKYYTYDENGMVIEQEEEDLDSFRKLKFTYSEQRISEVSQYNKEDKIVSKTTFSFDEKGRDRHVINYALDEVNPEELRIISEIIYDREE